LACSGAKSKSAASELLLHDHGAFGFSLSHAVSKLELLLLLLVSVGSVPVGSVLVVACDEWPFVIRALLDIG
jgi:hypothetical protein